MKVVVVGSGGREHGLAVALGRTAEVVVTPGNPGIPGSVATPPEEVEADLFGMTLLTEDAREGTSAFLEKRAAVFKGQ